MVLCQRQARSDGTSATEVYATHKAKPLVGPACATARRRAAMTAISFLKAYMELGSYLLFLQEQTKDIIIIVV